jgi:hypothetical protein
MGACAKSVAKNDVFKTARMWKPRIVLEKMGEARTTVRKKRAITEGGFRIWQLMDMLRNVTGSKIMCIAYPEQTSQITVSDLARLHLNDTMSPVLPRTDT